MGIGETADTVFEGKPGWPPASISGGHPQKFNKSFRLEQTIRKILMFSEGIKAYRNSFQFFWG
ncbi:MAG: hypothetical protein CM15mP117_03630 [Alphaproteobacteria bacterium]|nr:MAG: hypothetical protein CM15mP117_03630 [Alphaproteobacteria bacterium]